MGLLDDLRAQAEGRRAAEESDAARITDREEFYRVDMLPRMVKAYQFCKELVEHLNYIKLETIVDYPLHPNGSLQPLRQENYVVVIDSSKELKQIDLTFQCVLEEPISFELYNKEEILSHSDRLDRYYIKYERKDRKTAATLELAAAKFTVLGPLPLKVGITANIANSDIRIALRNFTEPGTSTFTLKAEQFDESFLDRLGKVVLRQESSLFPGTRASTSISSELSEDAKAQLREKILQEQKQREQELQDIEDRRKAEEAVAKEKTAKEQIKRVVNTQVVKGKEGLKDILSKLKKQASVVLTPEPKQTPAPIQTAQPAPLKPPLSEQARPQPAIQRQAKPQPAKTPATPAQTSQQAPRPMASAVRQQKPVTAPPPVEVAQKQQASITRAADAPAPAPANAKMTAPQATRSPVTPSVKKKAQPPKVFTASPDNPFLKPEPIEETPASEAEQVTDKSEEKSVAESATKMTASIEKQDASVTSEDLERDLTRIMESEKPGIKSQNPFLTPASGSAQTAQSSERAVSANPFLQTSKTNEKSKPILKPGELSTDLSANLTIPSEDKHAEETPLPEIEDPSQNPFLKSEELDIDVSGNVIPPQVNDSKKSS